jgi:hypothetical protein
MAHVKCEYTQYKCGNVMYGFTGEGCEHLCDGCSWLDPQPGFLETTSKKVSWDGETLMIGNRDIGAGFKGGTPCGKSY